MSISIMLKNLLAVGVIGTAILVTGCQTTPNAAAGIQANNLSLLQSKTWYLTQIGHTEIKTTADRNTPTLQFDQSTQRLSGSDGCNRIMGSYTAGRDTLTLGPVASTRMACLNNGNIDQQFNEALAKTANYQAYGKTLKLTDRHGNVVLQFTSEVPQQ